ncbi:MAG TPA: hypothetical protein PK610_07570, partial [Flavobacteriales bacterium]|nr:hypothetical protein [Flavobacteriales bacterium]
PFFLGWGVVHFQKMELRKSIKHKIIAGIDRGQLTLIKATPKNEHLLHWHHSKEFEYQGEMYDIVEKSVSGDTTIYWCWWDNEETALNKTLNDLWLYALGKVPNSNKQSQLLDFFFKSIYHDYSENNSAILFSNSAIKATYLNIRPTQNGFSTDFSPPPEAA